MEVLNRRRGTAKAALTRVETLLAASSVPPQEAGVRLDLVKDVWVKFTNIQQEITDICNPDEMEEQEKEHQLFEDRLVKIKVQLMELSTQTNSSNPGSSSSATQIKLLRIDLPTFDGDYQLWTSFHDLFMSLIHNNGSLLPLQKLHHLKSSLRGAATSILDSLESTDSNYNEAWKLLTNRYQNKRLIVHSHIASLFALNALSSESSVGLRNLLDSTMKHIRALHVLACPTDTWDDILVYLISSKFDKDTRRWWELSLQSENLPKFQELQTFLENRCRSLENSQLSSPPHSSISSARSVKSLHASASSVCILCETVHPLYKCLQFNSLPVNERVDLVKSHSLCFNCLSSGYISKDCKSSMCRKCDHKHHTLLHYDKSIGNKSLSEEYNPNRQSSSLSNSQRDATPVMNHLAHEMPKGSDVLLATAMIKVTSHGIQHLCRALLDSGSQASFITEACRKRLKLRYTPHQVAISGLCEQTAGNSFGAVTVGFSGIHSIEPTFCVSALVMSKLTSCIPHQMHDPNSWTHIHDLKLADPTYFKPGKIDILLGADIFGDLISNGIRNGSPNQPTAINSHLGWIIFGRVPATQSQYQVMSHHVTCEMDLQRFWQVEELTAEQPMSLEEKHCENHFQSTHCRDSTGRYIVRLPLRDSIKLGDSRELAMHRLKQMERKLTKNPDKQKQYSDFMQEYINLGHMKPVHPSSDSPSITPYYIPHHSVYKDSSTTTKLRVVFDASAKTSNQQSLNDKLFVGPTVQDELVSILLRFRLHKIAFVADIAKMYRQVLVHPDDQHLQRILWRDTPENEVLDYQLQTVTYGTACGSYLATKVLQQLGLDGSAEYPIAAKILKKDFYVDDLMSGAPDVQSALDIQHQLVALLKTGGFDLRKWSFNNEKLLESLPPDLRETKPSLKIEFDSSVKTLGIMWCPLIDHFSFSVNVFVNTTITKRTVLSYIARLFNPLGWISPVTVLAKLFIQKLWIHGLNWDDVLPPDLQNQWLHYSSYNAERIENSTVCWCNAARNTSRASWFLRQLREGLLCRRLPPNCGR